MKGSIPIYSSFFPQTLHCKAFQIVGVEFTKSPYLPFPNWLKMRYEHFLQLISNSLQTEVVLVVSLVFLNTSSCFAH